MSKKWMTFEEHQELVGRVESIDDEGHKFRKKGLLDLLEKIRKQYCYQRDYFHYELETVDGEGNRIDRER